ncbi:MAG: CcoQ/FixQ family Cbb3-type cytochrome c oxidase assembly chaperone [Cyclobacteriaceae bacterium]
MLKFIKHHMETIVGIEIFPLISFVIFFVFFIGLFVYVLRANKTELNLHSQLPLDAKEESNAQI